MSSKAVANRYAVALFQVAKEQGTLEQVGNELQLVKNVFSNTDGFIELINHPKVENTKKLDLIRESFSNAVSKTVLNTLLLLVERNRMGALYPLIKEFEKLSFEERNIAFATVYSTVKLTEEQQQLLSSSFAKKVGKETLYIENIVDPTLLGGLRIRIGDRIFDGSVKTQLDRLERQLVAGKR
ncbi:F0F1 ATP synthase subunit delta [Bacillus sp. FJAT-45350]|uniref:F0F1 ATP synthase subunit delta n=1 Tax=Bacillus sp. FJAT-45350 TaxID=2011014 RepID=UPI000BB67EFE|nr:F0F1 ATP synthase subunit delta [Bacillus sp. FJAT-45350]